MPVIKECEQCGTPKVIPSYRAASFRFCSNACHGVFLGGGIGKQARICRQCGKVDIVEPSSAKRPYCSQACYGRSIAGPRTTAAHQRARRRAQSRLYRPAHRKELAARQRLYYAGHKEQYERNIARRRMRKKAGRCDLTTAQWRLILAAYGSLCAYCRNPAVPLTKDHIVPLARGGEHTALNIVPACQPCNSQKWASSREPWRPNDWDAIVARLQRGRTER